MGDVNIFDVSIPFQIPKKIRIRQEDFDIDRSLLPRQSIQGVLKTNTGVRRCLIDYKEHRDYGAHGSIRMANRVDLSGSISCCVKIPHNPRYSLCPEAVVQWMAGTMLRDNGIFGAIPEVFDIFQYAGETRFSMEYINGLSATDKIIDSVNPTNTCLQILGQISLLLAFLERYMFLDHRDLKINNLWIRSVPISYTLTMDGVVWHMDAPFQVVILDFGFSCIGGTDGNALVSLSDGILPVIDPCPKEGRDLFQLLSSILYIPAIRSRLDTSALDDMEQLLSLKPLYPQWIYLLVSDSKFRHPSLRPCALLETLRLKYECVQLYKK
jgi:hypothetical protein